MAALESEDELIKVIGEERDPVAIANALKKERLIPPSLLSQILELNTARRSQAQKLAEHFRTGAKIHPEWYSNLLGFLSQHQWLREIAEVLDHEQSQSIQPSGHYSGVNTSDWVHSDSRVPGNKSTLQLSTEDDNYLLINHMDSIECDGLLSPSGHTCPANETLQLQDFGSNITWSSPTSSSSSVSIHHQDLDSLDLHKLCRTGKLDKIQEVVKNTDPQVLSAKLATQKGVFGYTVLHEAVASRNTEILDFLLQYTDAASVNSVAKSGYTPLHMAASSGLVGSVHVLLKHNADVNCTDEFGRTPRSAARLSSRYETEKLLFSDEVIKELQFKENSGRFEVWLRDKDYHRLFDPSCLKRALLVATRKDSSTFINMLVEKGAMNIEKCLQVSIAEKKPKARATFLLIKAAKEGNAQTIKRLYKEEETENSVESEDEEFKDAQEAVVSGKISTALPIKIARSSGHTHVRELLLMRTNVKKECCKINWHGLQLQQLEVAWLKKIFWVRTLILTSNGFRSLPNEMEMYLNKVVKLFLHDNQLISIPQCLFQLPNLEELNLSHNKLQEIPRLSEWSPCLYSLNLSHNQLSTINPKEISASSLSSLNLAKNKLRHVPPCICSFTALRSLDLSDNPDIMVLPTGMGQLSSIFELNLTGLNDINDPPKAVQKDPISCIRYLNNKQRCPQRFYRMKLMLVGCANRGKTTLVACLQGRKCGNESTVGIDISEWSYRSSFNRPKFHFSIWDFGGQEEYYATHQCFLSQESLYLLLFNLTHGREGVKELQPWLNNLSLRVPKSCVIIVGTHLDKLRNEMVEDILALVSTTIEVFKNRLQIVDTIAVGLKNNLKNVAALKNAIYTHAANYKNKAGLPVMGRSIPASYHVLDKQLQKVRQEVRQGLREPIMHLEEFKAMVHKMKLTDMEDEQELKTATLFLTDAGSLLHYDDRRHNLHELYFVDPRWLCDMMATVITVKERNSFIKGGILHNKHLPFLFKDQRFLQQYINQYLTLLDQFEIAIPLSVDYMLIPSMLPEEMPSDLMKKDSDDGPSHSRLIIFNSGNTPPGFWSRLLSRVIHSIPNVASILQMPATSKESSDDFTISNSFTKASSDNQSISLADIKSRSKSYHSMPQAPLLDSSSANTFCLSGTINNSQLYCWCTGLYYSNAEITFIIKSLSDSTRLQHDESRDGVLIKVSNSSHGKRIMCKLVDLVVELVSEWYSGLQDKKKYGPYGLEQRVLCFECIKQGIMQPYEFKVQECLAQHSMNERTIICRKFVGSPIQNHTVKLSDIVPDALLEDIDPTFLLEAEEIKFQEDATSFLGSGSYGRVYCGICHGKPVAVKKFTAENSELAYSEIRTEAKLLQHLHHPCLICLVGVCISLRAIVLEEAPLKSLEHPLIKKKVPMHRLTVFRVASQVAAALCFLHTQGIIYRDIKAANVLMWTLDPESLCHCKVSDFSIASHLPLTGTRGMFGTKGFIAPEVLGSNHCSIYDEKADIFSFSMFLYQLITRRYPLHYNPLQGERPKLHDIDTAQTGYYYLTELMKSCWHENPRNRPSTDKIIQRLSSCTVQAVMSVTPIKSQLSLRRGVIVSPAIFANAGYSNKTESELWICSDGLEGMEVNVYNTHTMAKILNQPYFKENQFCCMTLCGDNMWICSRDGVEYGVVDIVSIDTYKSVHGIQLNNVFIVCIAATDEAVYVGTNKGYCFSFPVDAVKKQAGSMENKFKRISRNPIKGISSTHEYLWVSQGSSITFVTHDSLEIQGEVHRTEETGDYIGELYLSSDRKTVWSAHIGNTLVSAWDAHNRSHNFDISIEKFVDCIASSGKINKQDFIITAVTPALDTVWVGTASGHILLFHNQELLTWYEPYRKFVSFLTCIEASGPCGMEKCIVASGGRNPKPLYIVDSTSSTSREGGHSDSERTETLIMWEAYDAKTVTQVKMIENSSPGYLNNHESLQNMIQEGKFKDGTCISAIHRL